MTILRVANEFNGFPELYQQMVTRPPLAVSRHQMGPLMPIIDLKGANLAA